MKYPKFSPAHRESKSYPFQCFETPEIDLNFKVYSHRWRWIFNSDYYTPPKIRKWPKCDENPKYTPKDELGFAPLVPSSMHHPIKYISNNSFRSDKHRNAESNAEKFFWVPPREKLEIYSTQNIIYYIFLHVWMWVFAMGHSVTILWNRKLGGWRDDFYLMFTQNMSSNYSLFRELEVEYYLALLAYYSLERIGVSRDLEFKS